MTLALPRLDRTTAEERGLTIADFLVPIRVGERLNTRVRDVTLVIAGALLVYLPWVLAYVLTDPIIFDERVFLLFATTLALVWAHSHD